MSCRYHTNELLISSKPFEYMRLIQHARVLQRKILTTKNVGMWTILLVNEENITLIIEFVLAKRLTFDELECWENHLFHFLVTVTRGKSCQIPHADIREKAE